MNDTYHCCYFSLFCEGNGCNSRECHIGIRNHSVGLEFSSDCIILFLLNLSSLKPSPNILHHPYYFRHWQVEFSRRSVPPTHQSRAANLSRERPRHAFQDSARVTCGRTSSASAPSLRRHANKAVRAIMPNQS